ncbi:MAG: MFS transporter [Pyrinomonadaceae bacterium]
MPDAVTITATDDHRPLKVLVHIVFFLSGISTVLIGQVLPILAREFDLNDLEAGYFFPAQFAGTLTGTVLTNWFGRRRRFDQATAAGALLMAAGVLLMNWPSFAVCLVGFALNGVGIGLTLPAINMLVLELNPTRSAAALSILNFCWGAGAIVCKPFVDYSGRGSIGVPTVILAAAMVLIAAALIMLPRAGRQSDSRPHDDARGQEALGDSTPIWSTPLAWALALFNFLHVGFESGMGGWLTTYTARVEGENVTSLLSPTFLFFLFFVIGRGVAPLFFRYVGENAMLLASLGVILLGMIVTLSADSLGVLAAGASIAGFGTSSIFPTNLSRFGRTFGAAAMARRATPFFICGTIGAATVNWLIGYLSDRMSDLRSGMFVLLAGIVILIVLQSTLMLRGKKTAAAGETT